MPEPIPKLSPSVRRRLTQIAEHDANQIAEYPSDRECGIWVRKTDLPAVTSQDILDGGGVLEEGRSEALRAGASPNAIETEQFLEGWIQAELEGCGDLDVVPTYVIARVCDEAGNEGWALILRTGYSFTQIRTWVEAVFASEEEAVSWMESRGWRT